MSGFRRSSRFPVEVAVHIDHDGLVSASACIRSKSGRRGKSRMERCGHSYDSSGGPTVAVSEALAELAQKLGGGEGY